MRISSPCIFLYFISASENCLNVVSGSRPKTCMSGTKDIKEFEKELTAQVDICCEGYHEKDQCYLETKLKGKDEGFFNFRPHTCIDNQNKTHELSAQCNCPIGYESANSSSRLCRPKCEPNCKYGFCVGPNTCSRYNEFTLESSCIDSNECLMTCNTSCSGGHCKSMSGCNCREGYEWNTSLNTCIEKSTNQKLYSIIGGIVIFFIIIGLLLLKHYIGKQKKTKNGIKRYEVASANRTENKADATSEPTNIENIIEKTSSVPHQHNEDSLAPVKPQKNDSEYVYATLDIEPTPKSYPKKEEGDLTYAVFQHHRNQDNSKKGISDCNQIYFERAIDELATNYKKEPLRDANIKEAYSNFEDPIYEVLQKDANTNFENPIYDVSQKDNNTNFENPIYDVSQKDGNTNFENPIYDVLQKDANTNFENPIYDVSQKDDNTNLENHIYDVSQKDDNTNFENPIYDVSQKDANTNFENPIYDVLQMDDNTNFENPIYDVLQMDDNTNFENTIYDVLQMDDNTNLENPNIDVSQKDANKNFVNRF